MSKHDRQPTEDQVREAVEVLDEAMDKLERLARGEPIDDHPVTGKVRAAAAQQLLVIMSFLDERGPIALETLIRSAYSEDRAERDEVQRWLIDRGVTTLAEVASTDVDTLVARKLKDFRNQGLGRGPDMVA